MKEFIENERAAIWVRPIAINYCTKCNEMFKSLADEKSVKCFYCESKEGNEENIKAKTWLRK